MARGSKKQEDDEDLKFTFNVPSSKLVKVLGTLWNQIGAIGSAVIMVFGFVVVYASKEQKKEIIDTWFLLDDSKANNTSVLIVISLIVLLVLQGWFNKKSGKLDKERIDFLNHQNAELKAALQERNSSSHRRR